MKFVSVLALIPVLCGSSSAGRSNEVDSWADMYQDSTAQPRMNLMMVSDKNNEEIWEPDFSKVMNEVSDKLDQAINQGMSHLTSVLMLKDSSVSEGLRSKISEFKESLVQHLERDLVQVVDQVKRGRTLQGPLTDDEEYAFSDSLKIKWEQTVTQDLESFQRKSLPSWISSVRSVWKGIEEKVMERIEKFKVFIHKTTPRSGDTCALPNAILLGSNAISTATKSLNRVDLSDRDSLIVAGKVTLFILAVAGTVILAIAAPLVFYVIMVLCIVGMLAADIFHAASINSL